MRNKNFLGARRHCIGHYLRRLLHKRREHVRFGKAPLVALIMITAGCTTYSDAAGPNTLVGPTWHLMEIETGNSSAFLTSEQQAVHTLTFGEDSSLRMQLDCNRGTADWTSGEANGITTISIGPVASTRAFCPPPSYGEDLAATLPSTRNYSMANDGKNLIIGTGQIVYIFEAR